MKAIVVKQAGGVEQLQLEEYPVPSCGDDEVLVQVKAAGINFIDIYLRTGLYPALNFPYTPGKEGSGVVVETGKNVTDIKVGDRVGFCSSGTGTYAEYVAIPANQVVIIPASISFEVAAAVMLQGLTAYYLSHETILIRDNHTVLIHAGAGGVGLLLIQMAKMLGAKVITTVSSDEKARVVSEIKADKVIIYTKESFLAEVLRYTNGTGVNIVYDSVGETTFKDSLEALTVRGMLVTYGQSSGAVSTVALKKLAEKSLYVTRPSLFHYTRTKEELRNMSEKFFELITNNKVKIVIGQRYRLEEAARAQSDLEARKTIGKSLLIMQDN